ncbi:uncharacterized protein TRIADDRAFT_20412 [Trichoplax adhaerens]|uniref:Nicotinamide phosphoribosyltransferase n=1 Tax=Trichoplax adhaerens TaxID=10228 RepID=B3RP13_TRIAD|nr:hypothetical protein TRIADDRAFT_20412 [Trichoplax adhaerens]EDV27553.1 hypothetical protein TRIADDRAFT_20412 [Trichoplax adhaerens]|eukprot:XP_002109387.1 hypothetical protein TRIADDRAFT_20412 [Trichoplax adhaerens]
MCDICFDNLLLLTDSYKFTHFKQYPPKTTKVYSYFESRGGKFENVVFFGLQYIIKRLLLGKVVTKEKIDEAKAFSKAHFGRSDAFNEAGWQYILDAHDGKLPIKIKAVPEGTVLPQKNVLFTVENTDPNCFWLTNYLETLFVQVWYPITVASNSRAQKEVIAQFLHETADDMKGLPFKLHDFGFRGATSIEAAGIGGMSHLVNFLGTDTLAGILTARKYYGCPMAGFSIPAAEHSTITTWQKSGEKDAFENMCRQFPTGTIACVSDSYDIWNACENLWGKQLKNLLKCRDGTLVVRPDSGDPPEVVSKVLHLLGEAFGTIINKKGYKTLPPFVRIIQGDGIDLEMIKRILNKLKSERWSSDNLAFGSGGALLQKLNRDTLKCAYKCSMVTVDSKEINVFKQPIDDPGKKSKKGLLTLEYSSRDGYKTVEEGRGNATKDLLIPVFENGKLLKEYTFDEIRSRCEIPLLKK